MLVINILFQAAIFSVLHLICHLLSTHFLFCCLMKVVLLSFLDLLYRNPVSCARRYMEATEAIT